MTAPLLELRELCVRYRGHGRAGGVRAVDGVSFTLERGQSLGLVGESGCGKSTLARALVGLERVHSGALRFDGRDLAKGSAGAWRDVRRRVGYVPQDPFSSLDPRLCVSELLTEPLVVHGVGRRRTRPARAIQLLEAVGLKSTMLERYAHEFSGGQRQRLAIARALALEPELLILDEPTSALDVSVRVSIVALLRELRERFGLAYLFISHDLAVVRLLCERVAVMYLGRVAELAESTDLFGAPRHPYTQALLAAAPVPDPGRARAAAARSLLQGEPPSPRDAPGGCRYHPRCAARRDVPGERCAREEPLLRPSGPRSTTEVACHLYADSQPAPATR
jgi:oligopeptide transport system ATP-binding protein